MCFCGTFSQGTPLPGIATFSTSIMQLWIRFRNAWLQWIAAGLERHVRLVYSAIRDVSKPAPAQRSFALLPMEEGKRRRVCVNPKVAWDVLLKARSSGTSPAQVLRIRDSDPHIGCHHSLAGVWVNKLQHMYVQRRSLVFGPGVHHWNLVVDPARHATKEAMVGVAWSWETQTGGYPDFQWIPATKQMTPFEQEMPDFIADMASSSRLERVASFRQLQAVSWGSSVCRKMFLCDQYSKARFALWSKALAQLHRGPKS